MSRHIKIVVAVLLAAVIILAVGIIRFYSDVSKNTGSSNNTEEIIRKLDIDADGNRIFEGSGSFYGVVDANDKVIVSPEWAELTFAGDGFCIASKRINGKLLTGCIDYEGNIAVPFIYRNIIEKSSDEFRFYIAESESDGSYVLYDTDFNPCFMRGWESCEVNGNELTLADGESTFTYAYGENGLQCKEAVIIDRTLERRYELNIISRVILSKLDCIMLDKASDCVSAYMTYAYKGDGKKLRQYTEGGGLKGFSQMFPEDERITSKKLLGISDVFIYSEKSDADNDYYCASVIADTQIKYTDENGDPQTLRDEYKAVIRFSASETDIMPVSGSFVKAEPDYPQPEENIPEPTAEAENIQ